MGQHILSPEGYDHTTVNAEYESLLTTDEQPENLTGPLHLQTSHSGDVETEPQPPEFTAPLRTPEGGILTIEALAQPIIWSPEAITLFSQVGGEDSENVIRLAYPVATNSPRNPPHVALRNSSVNMVSQFPAEPISGIGQVCFLLCFC